MPVPHVPDGHHAVTPYLAPRDADACLAFIRTTFEAVVDDETRRPDGTLMHAELKIGDSYIMLGQPADPARAMASSVYVYVPDTDAAYRRALALGAESIMEPADQFYGDRNAGVKDTNGNVWWIGTHVEDVPLDELARRARKAAGHA